MAAAFNLVAQLQLKGPTNVRQVVSQLNRQLKGIKLNVQISKGIQGQMKNLVQDANKVKGAFDAIGASANKARQQMQQLAGSAKAASTGITGAAAGANKAGKNVQNLGNQAKFAGSKMFELGQDAGIAARRFIAFSAVVSVLYRVTGAIGDATKEAIDFDRELVRIAQVAGTTKRGLNGLVREVRSLASGLGVDSSELLSMGRILKQTGLSINDTTKAMKALGKASLAPTFKDMESTAEGAVAMMAQWGNRMDSTAISVANLEQKLGSINAVAGKFAVEAQDIMFAIRRTGGVFEAVGGTVEELIATFTSIRAATRESAETIATGLRTIFTRIQRPETIDMLKELGINLRDMQGNFIGAYPAVQQLGMAMEALRKSLPAGTDLERSELFIKIAEQLGGYRQIGKVLPMLSRYKDAQKALSVAQAGTNSIARDTEKAQQALAIQFKKTQESFKEMIHEFTQTDTFKELVQVGLQLANVFIGVAKALKDVLPLIMMIGSVKLARAILPSTKGFMQGLGSGGLGGKTMRGLNSGGVVGGTGNFDTVPAMLTPGEFVVRKKAAQAIGYGSLANMNRVGGYNSGGKVTSGRRNYGVKFMHGKPSLTGGHKSHYTKLINQGNPVAAQQYMNKTIGQHRLAGRAARGPNRMARGVKPMFNTPAQRYKLNLATQQAYASHPFGPTGGSSRMSMSGAGLSRFGGGSAAMTGYGAFGRGPAPRQRFSRMRGIGRGIRTGARGAFRPAGGGIGAMGGMGLMYGGQILGDAVGGNEGAAIAGMGNFAGMGAMMGMGSAALLPLAAVGAAKGWRDSYEQGLMTDAQTRFTRSEEAFARGDLAGGFRGGLGAQSAYGTALQEQKGITAVSANIMGGGNRGTGRIMGDLMEQEGYLGSVYAGIFDRDKVDAAASAGQIRRREELMASAAPMAQRGQEYIAEQLRQGKSLSQIKGTAEGQQALQAMGAGSQMAADIQASSFEDEDRKKRMVDQARQTEGEIQARKIQEQIAADRKRQAEMELAMQRELQRQYKLAQEEMRKTAEAIAKVNEANSRYQQHLEGIQGATLDSSAATDRRIEALNRRVAAASGERYVGSYSIQGGQQLGRSSGQITNMAAYNQAVNTATSRMGPRGQQIARDTRATAAVAVRSPAALSSIGAGIRADARGAGGMDTAGKNAVAKFSRFISGLPSALQTKLRTNLNAMAQSLMKSNDLVNTEYEAFAIMFQSNSTEINDMIQEGFEEYNGVISQAASDLEREKNAELQAREAIRKIIAGQLQDRRKEQDDYTKERKELARARLGASGAAPVGISQELRFERSAFGFGQRKKAAGGLYGPTLGNVGTSPTARRLRAAGKNPQQAAFMIAGDAMAAVREKAELLGAGFAANSVEVEALNDVIKDHLDQKKKEVDLIKEAAKQRQEEVRQGERQVYQAFEGMAFSQNPTMQYRQMRMADMATNMAAQAGGNVGQLNPQARQAVDQFTKMFSAVRLKAFGKVTGEDVRRGIAKEEDVGRFRTGSELRKLISFNFMKKAGLGEQQAMRAVKQQGQLDPADKIFLERWDQALQEQRALQKAEQAATAQQAAAQFQNIRLTRQNLIQQAAILKAQQQAMQAQGNAKGGLIRARKFANGNLVDFSPQGTDTVPAVLTPGEFVIQKSAVDKYGSDMMGAINAGAFANGGIVPHQQLQAQGQGLEWKTDGPGFKWAGLQKSVAKGKASIEHGAIPQEKGSYSGRFGRMSGHGAFVSAGNIGDGIFNSWRFLYKRPHKKAAAEWKFFGPSTFAAQNTEPIGSVRVLERDHAAQAGFLEGKMGWVGDILSLGSLGVNQGGKTANFPPKMWKKSNNIVMKFMRLNPNAVVPDNDRDKIISGRSAAMPFRRGGMARKFQNGGSVGSQSGGLGDIATALGGAVNSLGGSVGPFAQAAIMLGASLNRFANAKPVMKIQAAPIDVRVGLDSGFATLGESISTTIQGAIHDYIWQEINTAVEQFRGQLNQGEIPNQAGGPGGILVPGRRR